MSEYLTKQDIERIADYIVERIQKPQPPIISAQPGSITCFCGRTEIIGNEMVVDFGQVASFNCDCGRVWKLFWAKEPERKQ